MPRYVVRVDVVTYTFGEEPTMDFHSRAVTAPSECDAEAEVVRDLLVDPTVDVITRGTVRL